MNLERSAEHSEAIESRRCQDVKDGADADRNFRESRFIEVVHCISDLLARAGTDESAKRLGSVLLAIHRDHSYVRKKMKSEEKRKENENSLMGTPGATSSPNPKKQRVTTGTETGTENKENDTGQFLLSPPVIQVPGDGRATGEASGLRNNGEIAATAQKPLIPVSGEGGTLGPKQKKAPPPRRSSHQVTIEAAAGDDGLPGPSDRGVATGGDRGDRGEKPPGLPVISELRVRGEHGSFERRKWLVVEAPPTCPLNHGTQEGQSGALHVPAPSLPLLGPERSNASSVGEPRTDESDLDAAFGTIKVALEGGSSGPPSKQMLHWLALIKLHVETATPPSESSSD